MTEHDVRQVAAAVIQNVTHMSRGRVLDMIDALDVAGLAVVRKADLQRDEASQLTEADIRRLVQEKNDLIGRPDKFGMHRNRLLEIERLLAAVT